jgi:hypothetical protein
MGWPVMIGDWPVPMWMSWIGLVAGGFAFFGLRLKGSMHAETSRAASVRRARHGNKEQGKMRANVMNTEFFVSKWANMSAP